MPSTTREDRVRTYANAILGFSREKELAPAAARREKQALKERAKAIVAWMQEARGRTEQVASTLERLRTNAPLTSSDLRTIEAVILPTERPVADIIDGKLAGLPPGEFSSIMTDAASRARVEAALVSVGCVLVPNDPRYPYRRRAGARDDEPARRVDVRRGAGDEARVVRARSDRGVHAAPGGAGSQG
jgi:hypothetical protein